MIHNVMWADAMSYGTQCAVGKCNAAHTLNHVGLQEERLRSLYAKHHEDRAYLALLAEDMPGGFSKGQISSQLRKLGLKQGAASSKHKGRKRKQEVCIDISAHLDNVKFDGLCFTPLSV